MILIENLIVEILKEKLPEFDPLILDYDLVKIIFEDFKQYMCYVYNATWFYLEIDKSVEIIKVESTEDYVELTNFIFEEYSKEEIEEYMNAWVSMWLKQWRRRVKLIFDEKLYNDQYRQLTKLIRKGKRRLSYQQILNMMQPVAECLIKNGEIAGTRVLSEQIILQELGKDRGKLLKLEDKLNFLNRVMKRARIVSYMHGPLIFIKIERLFKK